jgi:hypothetical protein
MKKDKDFNFSIEFLKSDYFIDNYETELVFMILSDIKSSIFSELQDDEFFGIGYMHSDEYEIKTLENALLYISKSSRVISQLVPRNLENNKKVIQFAYILQQNSYKSIFISKKLLRLGVNIDVKKTIISNTYTKTKTNLISGKQVNLYERFLIANEVLQIETKIRTLKISEAEKHNLLSLILGCNIDNAKKIMNGSYDAKVKEDLLQDYFKTLKK